MFGPGISVLGGCRSFARIRARIERWKYALTLSAEAMWNNFSWTSVRNGFVVQPTCYQLRLKTLEAAMPRNRWIARNRRERNRRWQLISSHLRSHPRRKNVVSKQANLISTKLQDNLRHITYTHKPRIRCTPRLKYRLDISIRNYIVTTMWLVRDIFTSMPHLDSYAT